MKPVKIREIGRNKDGRMKSEFKCYCGNLFTTQDRYIESGHTLSCGCFQKYKASISNATATHKMSYSREYRTWSGMKSRCFNKNSPDYTRYGGRGIKVCERWMKFENFLEDMGERPSGKSLDRINNDGNYCKENCRWSTCKEQSCNMRSNIFIEFMGMRKTLSQWAKYIGISKSIISHRNKKYHEPSKILIELTK